MDHSSRNEFQSLGITRWVRRVRPGRMPRSDCGTDSTAVRIRHNRRCCDLRAPIRQCRKSNADEGSGVVQTDVIRVPGVMSAKGITLEVWSPAVL